ncbi:efflux RND transporter permease subunit [Klebsiella pneumoniae]|nr:efflux RND transporter permease subunit [Klebsiella pneumoniae]
MVLAIGLLVDDAIVVVEKRRARDGVEEGLPPKEATRNRWDRFRRAGRYRDGAVGGIIPMAFFGGPTRGYLSPVLHHYRFRDGAVGTGCALILTPALCATMC